MKKPTIQVNDRGLRVGQSHHMARLTDAEVERIIRLHEGGTSYTDISRMMEVPKSTVSSICQGRRRCQTVARWKA